MCTILDIPFSESLLDILLVPITLLGFWIAFRQNKEDKIRKSRKPDLMNLMNFIYENYMKYSYLFDLREHDLVYQEASKNNNVTNELYVSFDDFNLNYIVASSQVPDYIIEPDKFAIKSKEIYEMALKIKQDINQYNETLNLFCENNGKWERDSIDDFRNILERISKETFLNTLELYNSLQGGRTVFKKQLKRVKYFLCSENEISLCYNENDFSSFKKNREKLIRDRLGHNDYSADGIWIEPQSLYLLRSFMCIPYTIYAVNNPNDIKPRTQHRLLYHTFLYDQLSIGDNCLVYNKLINDVTKSWIKVPKEHTHFFICDYITTIEEFLTYSSLKSKFTRCRFDGVYEHSTTNKFVGTKDLSGFLNDIQRLGINVSIVEPKSEISKIDCEEYRYVRTKYKEEAQNYMDKQKGNYSGTPAIGNNL